VAVALGFLLLERVLRELGPHLQHVRFFFEDRPGEKLVRSLGWAKFENFSVNYGFLLRVSRWFMSVKSVAILDPTSL
jgi:hypothetical protein